MYLLLAIGWHGGEELAKIHAVEHRVTSWDSWQWASCSTS